MNMVSRPGTPSSRRLGPYIKLKLAFVTGKNVNSALVVVKLSPARHTRTSTVPGGIPVFVKFGVEQVRRVWLTNVPLTSMKSLRYEKRI